jgi:hypothetical protein
MYSYVHLNLFFLFFLEKGHFLLVIRRLYPFFFKVVFMVYSLQSQFKIKRILSHEVARFFLKTITHWISFFL